MDRSTELATEAVKLAIQLWRSDFLKVYNDEPRQVDMFLRKLVADVRAGEITHSDASLALIIGQISAFPTAVKHGEYDQLSKRTTVTRKAIDKISLPEEQKDLLKYIISDFENTYSVEKKNLKIFENKMDSNIPEFFLKFFKAYRAYISKA